MCVITAKGERFVGCASMPKKKKTKQLLRETRLHKARQWILTYEGTHMVRAYRKRFKVDPTCAINDLEIIGALTPEKLANLRLGEEVRLRKKAEEREALKEREFQERWAESNDQFFFIAGYTPGGAPYGVTWEEMGLEPYEELE